jgi:hypothetical protein
MALAQSAAGLRDSQDFSTGERPKNFRELILWRDPNGSAPLTALMSKMRKESVDDSEFNWWEEEQKAVRVKVSAQITDAITTVALITTEDATALDLVAGDMLFVEKAVVTTYSYELVRVTSTPTAIGTVAITRGAAGTTAATIPANAFLLKVGSSYAEGSGAPDAASRNPTKYNNYAQIFKTSYNVTNTARKTRYRTGDPVKNDKKRKAFDHAAALEQAWFFGSPAEDVTGDEPLYYTGGLLHYLGLNYDATSKPTIANLTKATATEEDFLDATYGMWDFNVPESGDERIAFCGNGALNALNKMVLADSATRINYDGTIDMFGMRLQKWVLPQGTIFLKSHPLFNTNSYFTNSMAIINPPGIRYRPMDGRDTKFQDNIQSNDADQIKGQWITQAGVEYNHLRSMRWLQFV